MSENLGGPIPPDTQNPWAFLTWARGLLEADGLQGTQPFTQLYFGLVAQRSPSERDALLLQGKEVFGYLLGTGRDELRRLAKAGAAKVRVVPGLVTKEWMAEMVYRPGADPPFGFLKHTFARPDDAPEFVPLLAHGGSDYYPLASGLVESGAVLVPSEVEDYGDDEYSLFADLHSALTKQLILDPTFARLATAWAMYTWVADRFPVCTYLRVFGDLGTAKSVFEEVMAHLVFRGVLAAGGTNASPIFRIVDRYHCTLIVDEADHSSRNEEWQDILKLLNTGTKRGPLVFRSERGGEDGAFDVKGYDPYGPKMVASREPLRDAAFESRCLSYTMPWVPLTRLKDTPLFLDEKFFATARSLRNRLLLWRFNNYLKVYADPLARIEGVEEARVNVAGTVVLAAITHPRVKELIKGQFQAYSDQLRASRAEDSYTGTVAQTVCWVWVMEGAKSSFLVELVTNRVQMEEPKLTAQRIGRILKGALGLKTTRPRGTSYIVGLTRDTMDRLAEAYSVDLKALAEERHVTLPPAGA